MSVGILDANNGARTSAGWATNVLVMQAAISTHLSQSTGDDFSGEDFSGEDDFSGQQGMSPCMLIDVVMALIAATAESGAVMRPAIRKIASSREKMSERVTEPV
ncbi:MAG: hypothetical protein ABI192_13405 [Bradyrhizobium sp.]